MMTSLTTRLDTFQAIILLLIIFIIILVIIILKFVENDRHVYLLFPIPINLIAVSLLFNYYWSLGGPDNEFKAIFNFIFLIFFMTPFSISFIYKILEHREDKESVFVYLITFIMLIIIFLYFNFFFPFY